MNVEIQAESAQSPEKEYINGIAFAVQQHLLHNQYFRFSDKVTIQHADSFLCGFHIVL